MEKLLTKYFWVFNLAALAVVAFLTASGAAEMIASSVSGLLPSAQAQSGPQGMQRYKAGSSQRFSRRDGGDILKRNIFDSETGPIIPFDDEEMEQTVSLDGDLPLVPCTDNQLKLLATVAAPNDPDWSFATVQNGSDKLLYRIGDDVNGRFVSGITWRYLFLRGTSDECYIDMFGEQSVPGKKPVRARGASGSMKDRISVDGPNERTVDRSLLDEAMANPTKFARSVRVRPYKKNGKVTGFRLRRIKKGSPLEILGAKKGDIIHGVNGVPLTSADQALSIYSGMRTENQFVFDITRKGKKTTLKVNVK